MGILVLICVLAPLVGAASCVRDERDRSRWWPPSGKGPCVLASAPALVAVLRSGRREPAHECGDLSRPGSAAVQAEAAPSRREAGLRPSRREHVEVARGAGWRFAGNPFLFLAHRTLLEARLRSYILGQHRRGRRLSEILDDPYVRRCGSPQVCWEVVSDPATIRALATDIEEAVRASVPRKFGSHEPGGTPIRVENSHGIESVGR